MSYAYSPNQRLDDIKKEVFRLAYALNDERPYHAARQLKISPGMFYRWYPEKIH